MIAASTKLIDNQLCSLLSVIYSSVPNPLTPTNSWFNVQSGEAFAVYAWAHSDAGDPDLKIYVDMSPWTETLAFDTVDTTKYVTVELTSSANLTAQDTLTRYAPSDFDTPFCMIRVRVAGQGGNADDTLVTVALTQASESWPA